MSRLFLAYVAVDWSAASKPTTGADSIWIGVVRRNVRFQFVHEAHNPATRAEAEQILAGLLDDFSRRNERVLVGFDFPLGLPRGTAAAMKFSGAPWAALVDFVAAEVKDKPDNSNNRFQVAARMNRAMTGGPFPFWGAPARDAQAMLSAKRPRDHGPDDAPEFRYVEEKLKGAAPVWKLYYQGSVGGQTLTGLPMIKRLKAARPGVRVWPFETGWRALTMADLAGVEAVFAEIDPSMFNAPTAAGEIKDAARVRAAASHFAALDEKGLLGKAFGPVKDDPRRDVIEAEEGWVLGVT